MSSTRHKGQAVGHLQSEIHFFSSPSELNLLKICKTFVTSCYESALFCICVFLSTEAEVLDSFQKSVLSYLTTQTSRQQKAGQSPERLARAPVSSLRHLKQWSSTYFSSNCRPWKTHLLPVTVHTLLYFLKKPSLWALHPTHTHTHTHTHVYTYTCVHKHFPDWHSGARKCWK